MNIGDRFRVLKAFEARDEASGQLLCRFVPDMKYALTQRNQPFVDAALARGDVEPVAARAADGFAVKAASISAKGSLTTGKKKG